MRADVQSTHNIYCPLCNAPLVYRTGDNAIGISDGTSSSHVFCSTCGYLGPARSRQHAQPSQPSQPRRRKAGSSVWIDPAVSTYLQHENIAQPAPATDQQGGPATPIPPRASAHRMHAVQVRPRYSYNRVEVDENLDPAEIPTLPPPATWQYDSREYTAESSLSSLSLIVDMPTNPCGIPAPPAPSLADTPPHGMPRIEDMDTRPPVIARSTIEGVVDSTIRIPATPATPTTLTTPTTFSPIDMMVAPGDEGVLKQAPADQPVQMSPARPSAAALFLDAAVTTPDAPTLALTPVAPAVPAISAVSIVPALQPVSAVAPFHGNELASAEPASWTAGAAAGSRYARLVAARTARQKPVPSFNFLDRLRWWLLHPGRFEFLLWIGGTILLMTVTCIFLLMMVFGLQLNTIGMNNRPTSSFQNSGSSSSGQPSFPGLSLMVMNASTLVAGHPFSLRGQGFSANGYITLTCDDNQPFLDPHGNAVQAQADIHGTFMVTLNNPAWSIGQHSIVARDLKTGHETTTLVTVVSPTGPANATPTTSTASATATAIQQGNNTPPVSQTPPVFPTATQGITPTPTPRPPTPTPTAGITPTPTVGITPTVTATPKLGQTPSVGITVTPGVSVTPTTGNNDPAVLNTGYIAGSASTPTGVSSWFWLLIGGYILAMLLFGFAGLLHKGGTTKGNTR